VLKIKSWETRELGRRVRQDAEGEKKTCCAKPASRKIVERRRILTSNTESANLAGNIRRREIGEPVAYRCLLILHYLPPMLVHKGGRAKEGGEKITIMEALFNLKRLH